MDIVVEYFLIHQESFPKRVLGRLVVQFLCHDPNQEDRAWVAQNLSQKDVHGRELLKWLHLVENLSHFEASIFDEFTLERIFGELVRGLSLELRLEIIIVYDEVDLPLILLVLDILRKVEEHAVRNHA